MQPLPALLAQARVAPGFAARTGLDYDTVREIVRRVCAHRVFRSRIFPRGCLRYALTLHHIGTQTGYPMQFQIGVAKDGDTFIAHSWASRCEEDLTTSGEPGRLIVLYVSRDQPASLHSATGA